MLHGAFVNALQRSNEYAECVVRGGERWPAAEQHGVEEVGEEVDTAICHFIPGTLEFLDCVDEVGS